MDTQPLQTTVVHTQQIMQSHFLLLEAVSIHLSDRVQYMGSDEQT